MITIRMVVLTLLLIAGGFSSPALAIPCQAPSSLPNVADCSSTVAGSTAITIAKTFINPFNPLDIVFTISRPAGSPFGFAVSETVLNSTGRIWNDFHMELGLGTGGAFVSFFPGQLPDVEFGPLGIKGFPATSNIFPVVLLSQHSPRALDFFGGSVLPGGSVTFSLSIVDGNIPVADGFTFTLRELPSLAVVPEPSTLGLLGLGLAGLGAMRRRKA